MSRKWFNRSCHSISAKCAMLPIVDSFMKARRESSGKVLGKLGPCTFVGVNKFFDNVLRKGEKQENKDIEYIHRYLKPYIPVKPGQIVMAIGDVHGDLLAFLGSLYLLGLINTEGDWIGGNSIIVQCGDLLDRFGRTASSPTDNVREEVDLVQYIYSLNKDANKVGGGVFWVLGNHDIARVLWKEYRGTVNEVKKDSVFLVKRTPDYSKYIGNQVVGWGGQKNMNKLFSPGGDMAIYMGTHTLFILQIGYYVFMHGGITIDSIDVLKNELNITDKNSFFKSVNRNVANSFILGIPMNYTIKKMAWDRTWSEEHTLKDDEKWEEHKYAISSGRGSDESNNYCTKNMRVIFEALGMNWEKGSFVLGHSVQKKGIPLYCDGRVWRIDVGMSDAFNSDTRLKVLGGIKIFMYPDKPVKVLVVMNYSTENGDEINDKFILYISRKFKKIMLNPEDPTNIGVRWTRGIAEIVKKEEELQKQRVIYSK